MKVDVEYIDVSSDRSALNKMRNLAGNSSLLAPQLFYDDKYLGVYFMVFIVFHDFRILILFKTLLKTSVLTNF